MSTDQEIEHAGIDLDHAVLVPADDLGVPSFGAYFDAVYQAVPAELLAHLADQPSTLPEAVTDHADRMAGALGHIVAGIGYVLALSYENPDEVVAAFQKALPLAVADAQEALEDLD